jgi:ferredoxin-NADP reductase
MPLPLPWRAVEIRDVIVETPRARSLVLRVADWPGHLAGQHVDVRLTAEDGYQTQRSYSIASPPEQPELVLTVERIEGGEVSPFLTDDARAGDQLELRGPIGGYFTWATSMPGPLQLIAGGSGIVPLMAMLRHRAHAHALLAQTPKKKRAAAVAPALGPARLLYSSRTAELIVYREELARLAHDDDSLEVTHALTRDTPPGWAGQTRRVDRDMLRSLTFASAAQPRLYICGPTPFVESVATDLVDLGHAPARIKTERFGPTG